MTELEVRFIEELSLNAHPALNTMSYDGWLVKFGDGHTNRANSVNMLYPSTLPMEQKVQVCEELYRSQNLPACFKITPLSEELDAILEKRGYEYVTKTNIMELSLDSLKENKLQAEVTEGFSQEVEEGYFSMIMIDERGINAARKIHRNLVHPQAWACIKEQGVIVAVGMCVIEQGYVGLYNIIVNREYRRKGYGTAICSSLLKKAKELGAHTGYLQVVDSNEKAKTMYEKLGYKYCYSYWYRVKK